MDIFVLNGQLKRDEILEEYESVIWTERYAAYGDFELHIKSSQYSRAWLVKGARLVTDKSDRVMIVESVEKKTDDNGVEMLVVTGRSIESILEDRAAVRSMATSSTDPYFFVGIPGDILRTLFHGVCVAGQVTSSDIIPMVAPPTFTRDPREPLEQLTWQVKPASMYTAIKTLCDVYELGFKLVRPSDNPVLQFYIYAGKNRTSYQTVNDPVIFSEDLGNIQNTKSLSSDQLVKNVVYLTSSAMNRIIYAPGVDPSVAGFQRRIVVIDLGDKGEPPNAGTQPERPPEPSYDQLVYTPEPDYGYPYRPPEPYYGYPPYGSSQYDINMFNDNALARREQWMREITYYENDWKTKKNTLKTNWQTTTSNEYTAWYNKQQADRNAWLTAYDTELAAWNAENITLYNTWINEINDDMTQKAIEEFEKYRPVNEFDGELNQRSSLRYKIDYDLGDLVELRNEDGVRYIRRATEQIFVGDKEGEKAYPTLSETVRTT